MLSRIGAIPRKRFAAYSGQKPLFAIKARSQTLAGFDILPNCDAFEPNRFLLRLAVVALLADKSRVIQSAPHRTTAPRRTMDPERIDPTHLPPEAIGDCEMERPHPADEPIEPPAPERDADHLLLVF